MPFPARPPVFPLPKKGERYTVDNLTVKRPGTGISPMQWYHLLGEKADRDYEPDELIKREKENG